MANTDITELLEELTYKEEGSNKPKLDGQTIERIETLNAIKKLLDIEGYEGKLSIHAKTRIPKGKISQYTNIHAFANNSLPEYNSMIEEKFKNNKKSRLENIFELPWLMDIILIEKMNLISENGKERDEFIKAIVSHNANMGMGNNMMFRNIQNQQKMGRVLEQLKV